MLIAAFTSRSWTAPHGQDHFRTFNGIVSASAPQAEHSLDDGKNRPTFANCLPYSFALYSSMLTNADQPASWTLLASLVRASPFTARSST